MVRTSRAGSRTSSEGRPSSAASTRAGLERTRPQVRELQKQDANLRRALRTASPPAAERITLEINDVAAELQQAQVQMDQLEIIQQPMRVTPKLIRDTINEMTGLLEHAALDTRVAWVPELIEQIEVDGRAERAVARSGGRQPTTV